jgi:hypothetical protein
MFLTSGGINPVRNLPGVTSTGTGIRTQDIDIIKERQGFTITSTDETQEADVTVDNTTGAFTVASDAKFSGLTLTGLAANSVVGTDASKKLTTTSVSVVNTIAGTANQITASSSTGNVTLSIPTTLKVNDTQIRNTAAPSNITYLSTTAGGYFDVVPSGNRVVLETSQVEVSANDNAADSYIYLYNAGKGAGVKLDGINDAVSDVYTQYQIGSTPYWTMGVDASDSKKFKLSASSALGTSDMLSVTTAGELAVTGDVSTAAADLRLLPSTGQINMGAVTGTLTASTKKVNLFDNGNTDSRFCGFSIDTASTIMHQRLNSSGWKLVWASGAVGATPAEQMRLGGNSEGLAIGTDTFTKRLTVNSATGDCLRLQYNTSTGTATNYTDFVQRSDGKLQITSSGGTSYSFGNWAPGTDATYTCGGSGARWSTLYTGAGNCTGTLTSGTDTATKQLTVNSATGACLRLQYNTSTGAATNYCDFAVSSGGNLTITPSGGSVTIAGQTLCGFKAYASALTDVTGDGTTYKVVFANEDFDSLTAFDNSSNSWFVAPTAGAYAFEAALGLSGLLVGHTTGVITIVKDNGAATSIATSQCNPYAGSTGGAVTLFASTYVNLAANEKVYVNLQVSGSTKVVDLTSGVSWTYFCGRRI